jgi:hypothetical protein
MSFAGCGGDDDSGEPMCAEINPSCETAYPPTWENVYKFTISQSCAAAGCHSANGVDGLSMSTQAEAYESLVNGVGGKPRVIKGDAACSILTERIESDDPMRWMPYRAPQKLSATDRCSIEKWIAAGAAQ